MPAVERLSADDLMQRAFDVGPLPLHVGAALVLDAELRADEVAAVLDARLPGARRLRQRLVGTPPGFGRPVWADDARFDVRRHVRGVRCPAPGGRTELLAVAVRAYTAPLPRDRPLWRAVVVGGLDGGRTGVVLVLHHVLVDGVGGLAVLEALVDGPARAADPPFPLPGPSRGALVRDAWGERLLAAGRLPATLGALRPAVTELGARPPRPSGAVLGRLGGGLVLGVARVPLEDVRAGARAHGATVNDAVLAAVGGALGRALADRGRPVSHLVVSVPVTAPRPADDPGAGGNRVGVMPVAVPTTGGGPARLSTVAAATSVRKTAHRGSSTTLSRPVFRALGALHAFGPFVRRQRLVDTFVTNVRGPARRLAFAGAAVTEVLPLGMVSGNVTVAFTVLSYAGTLTTTVAADPSHWPDVAGLAELVERELAALGSA